MANEFVSSLVGLNPFDGSDLTASSDADIATFLGVNGEQNNTVYNNVTGVKNYSTTTSPLVIVNKTINFGRTGDTGTTIGAQLRSTGVTPQDLYISLEDGADDSSQTPTTGTIPAGSSRFIFTTNSNSGAAANRLPTASNPTVAIGDLFSVGGQTYTLAGTRNLGSGSTIFYVEEPTSASVGDAVFTATSFEAGPAAFNVAAAGAHIYLINCRLSITNENPSTDFSDSYTPFFSRGAVVAETSFNRGSSVGTFGSNNRPADSNGQVSGSLGIHAYGTQFTFESTAPGNRTNMAFGVVESCTFLNNTQGSLRYYFHSNAAPNVTNAFQDGATYDNRIGGPDNFVNLHSSNYILRNPEFIGCAPFTNDGAALPLEGYFNPSPFVDSGGTRYYGIGNQGTNHGFYSINPRTRIPATDLGTSVVYNNNGAVSPQVRSALVIEASRYKPTFYSDAARSVPAQSIKADVNTQHSFVTAGNEFTLSNSLTADRNTAYTSDADGRFSSGDFNPFDGSSTVTFDQGLIYPITRVVGTSGVGAASTSSSVSFVTDISLRGLFHVVDDSDGIRRFSLTQANQVTRTDSNDVVEDNFFPVNPNLSTSLQTGTHSVAAYTSYINSTFPTSGAIERHTVQELYDLCNKLFYDNTTDIPFPVTSGNTVTFGADILLNSTVSSNTYSGDTLVLRSGGLTAALDADNTTVYDLVDNDLNNGGGPLTANITTTGDITNVRTTGILPDDNRGTDFDLAGDINGVINLNVNTNDVFLLTNLTTTTGLTINNTGNATVRIATATRPQPGGSARSQVPMTVTAGTNVEFEEVAALVEVREPLIAEFQNVASANWILIQATGDEFSAISDPAIGGTRVLARSPADLNNDPARVGTSLRFRGAFPEASGSEIAVPTDQRTNAAYSGLEIPRIGASADDGGTTRLILIVGSRTVSGSMTTLTVDDEINTRFTDGTPNPNVSSISVNSRSIAATVSNATAAGAQAAGFVDTTNDVLRITVTGHSPLNGNQRPATFVQTNSLLADVRNSIGYLLSLHNTLGWVDSSAYPRNRITTATPDVSIEFDIINTPTSQSVDVRQGLYRFEGGHDGVSNTVQLQQLSGVYEVLNDASLSPLPVTVGQLGQGISSDILSVDAIADNSRPIVDRADNSEETPSVLSSTRALTADLVSGLSRLTEDQVTAIVQTDGNRTRRNIPPPS